LTAGEVRFVYNITLPDLLDDVQKERMAISPDMKVTTQILWEGALIFALIDVVFVFVLRRRIRFEAFRQFMWTLVVTTGIFWCLLLGILMSWIFWEPVYHYVFPNWARWLIPPVYGAFFAMMGLLFWSMAMRFPRHAVVVWCLLGGLWGMITHIWAVYRGILDKPPMLEGASPVATVIMPIFEFVFYYCVILSLTALQRRGCLRASS
jgi:hypothetical protein